jgi:site-specific DNA-methyltransferase (cytosine-N4-specific)
MKLDTSSSGNYIGDCRKLLKRLPDRCVQTCITSPPYWGLRDYGLAGQIGHERTPELYVAQLVRVFSQVRRTLRDDGTLWLNLGDSYSGSRSGPQGDSGEMADREVTKHRAMQSKTKGIDPRNPRKGAGSNDAPNRLRVRGLKHKDLVGIPWMVAFALRADGWYLRSDIIWHKPNAMPESVADRPTKAHEYLFLLSKSERYYYDADSIREPLAAKTLTTFGSQRRGRHSDSDERSLVASHNWARDVPERKPRLDDNGDVSGANKRTVWTVATTPYPDAHFATFPPMLIEPCVLAGARAGDLVLDPFFGTGTTGAVAEKHERRWIGFDLGYAGLAKNRTAQRSLPLAVRR